MIKGCFSAEEVPHFDSGTTLEKGKNIFFLQLLIAVQQQRGLVRGSDRFPDTVHVSERETSSGVRDRGLINLLRICCGKRGKRGCLNDVKGDTAKIVRVRGAQRVLTCEGSATELHHVFEQRV